MLDGAEVEPPAIAGDGQPVELVAGDAGPAGELRADPLGRRGLVRHLAVDLAGGHVPAVTSQDRRTGGVLLAERGQHVQRREHPRVGEPEVAEVEVARVLAAEHGAGLGHPRLDERVPDPGAHRGPAVLGDDLGDRGGGDQVVDDRRAGLTGQFPDGDQRGEHRGRDEVPALVHHEAAVRVPVEGQPDVGPGVDHRALQVAQVRGLDRVRLVIRERPVQLEVERHDGRGAALRTPWARCARPSRSPRPRPPSAAGWRTGRPASCRWLA